MKSTHSSYGYFPLTRKTFPRQIAASFESISLTGSFISPHLQIMAAIFIGGFYFIEVKIKLPKMPSIFWINHFKSSMLSIKSKQIPVLFPVYVTTIHLGQTTIFHHPTCCRHANCSHLNLNNFFSLRELNQTFSNSAADFPLIKEPLQSCRQLPFLANSLYRKAVRHCSQEK